MKHLRFLCLCLSASLFFACGDDPIGGDTDVLSVIEHSLVQQEFNFLQAMVDVEARTSDELNKSNQTTGFFCECSTVEVIANGDGTYTMTLDYGTGCLCLDGRTRSGKLIGVFNKKWNEPNAAVTITPENYQVKLINGTTYDFSFTKTITQNGLNSAGNPMLSVSVQNAILTSEVHEIQWESERTVEWVEGVGSLEPETHVYEISGTAAGTSSTGVKFSVAIEEPLVVKANCAHITAGIMSLSPESKLTRSIDYGDGTCDAEAVVEIAGFTRTIELR